MIAGTVANEFLPDIFPADRSMSRVSGGVASFAVLVWIGTGLAGPKVQDPPAATKANRSDKKAAAAQKHKPVDPIAAALLAAHNRERKKAKLGPLSLSPELCAAALTHAKDMAQHHKLDHKGSDGSTSPDRVKRAGYVYVQMGENIADGQTSLEEVMTTWMESPPHREDILGDFTEMGAARALDDEMVPYWCVTFGAPMPRLKPAEAAAAVLKEWNQKRKEQKKAPLKAEPRLARAAMATAKAMADKESSKIEGDPFKLIGDRGPEGASSASLPVSTCRPPLWPPNRSSRMTRRNSPDLARSASVTPSPRAANLTGGAIFSRSIPRSRSGHVRDPADKPDEP